MKCLLVRSGGLGDCLLTLPAAARMKQRCADGELHVLGNGIMLDVAELSGLFSGYFSSDLGDFYGLYSSAEPSAFIRSFFVGYEHVYFYTTAEKKRIYDIVTVSGAKTCSILDPRPPREDRTHCAVHLLSILSEKKPAFHDVDELSLVVPCVRTGERCGLIIHPGSGGAEKNWPIERFIAAARQSPYPVNFLLGPAEFERNSDHAIKQAGYTILTANTLREVSYHLSHAQCYLGNDSGISHLAAACGTPSVVLFGPTDPAVWKPPGRQVTVIASRDRTMNGIRLDEVIGALEAF